MYYQIFLLYLFWLIIDFSSRLPSFSPKYTDIGKLTKEGGQMAKVKTIRKNIFKTFKKTSKYHNFSI